MSLALAPTDRLIGLVGQLEEMLLAELGELEGICAPAAAILAVRLRLDGMDPRVETGFYRDEETGILEPHAYVKLGRSTLDPTRGQFDDGAMISCGDPHYVTDEERWGPGLAPPERPSYSDARRFINGWWTAIDCADTRRAAMLRVLDAFERGSAPS